MTVVCTCIFVTGNRNYKYRCKKKTELHRTHVTPKLPVEVRVDSPSSSIPFFKVSVHRPSLFHSIHPPSVPFFHSISPSFSNHPSIHHPSTVRPSFLKQPSTVHPSTVHLFLSNHPPSVPLF